jgi:putative flippase GtrA
VTSRPDRTREQVVRFGVVGVLNTLVDYVVFISLTVAFDIPLSSVWIAKYPSSAVAMTVSYVLNRKWVFRSRSRRIALESARFVTATVIGIFVVQNLLTQFFASELPFFGKAVWHALDFVGIPLSEDFTIVTVAFALGTLASLTWNYLAYRFWAFRPETAPGDVGSSP